jgi:hypothetical protein
MSVINHIAELIYEDHPQCDELYRWSIQLMSSHDPNSAAVAIAERLATMYPSYAEDLPVIREAMAKNSMGWEELQGDSVVVRCSHHCDLEFGIGSLYLVNPADPAGNRISTAIPLWTFDGLRRAYNQRVHERNSHDPQANQPVAPIAPVGNTAPVPVPDRGPTVLLQYNSVVNGLLVFQVYVQTMHENGDRISMLVEDNPPSWVSLAADRIIDMR